MLGLSICRIIQVMRSLRLFILFGCLLGKLAYGQGLVKPQFLFDYIPGDTNYGMVDIASCLQLTPPVTPTIDASWWVAVVTLARENRVPSCAQCYTHIDGANVIGVLPIIKDTIREPFLVQSATPYVNHALPWFWTPSRPTYNSGINVLDPSTLGYLSGLTNQVTTDTITSFVAPGQAKFSYPVQASSATPVFPTVPAMTSGFRSGSSVATSVATPSSLVAMSASPYTQGIGLGAIKNPGTIFNGQYLAVPDTIEPLPDHLDFNSSGVAYPLAAFLNPGGNLTTPTGEISTAKTIEYGNRVGRSVLTVGDMQSGSLQRRNDPELTIAQQTSNSENYVRMYWPAKQFYTTAMFADASLSTNLQLCGVDYEVKEYGTIYPEVMASLRAAYDTWDKTSPPGAFWVTKGSIAVASVSDAHFNAVTKYWTGKP